MVEATQVNYAICYPLDQAVWDSLGKLRQENLDDLYGWDWGPLPTKYDKNIGTYHVLAYIGDTITAESLVGGGRLGAPIGEHPVNGKKVLEIGRLVVKKDFQRLGIGTAMLRLLEQHAIENELVDELQLTVAPEPTGWLERYYRNQGYELNSQKHNCGGAECVEMVKVISRGQTE